MEPKYYAFRRWLDTRNHQMRMWRWMPRVTKANRFMIHRSNNYPPVNKHSNGKSPSWIGNTSSNGGFSIAMLDYRKLTTMESTSCTCVPGTHMGPLFWLEIWALFWELFPFKTRGHEKGSRYIKDGGWMLQNAPCGKYLPSHFPFFMWPLFT